MGGNDRREERVDLVLLSPAWKAVRVYNDRREERVDLVLLSPAWKAVRVYCVRTAGPSACFWINLRGYILFV